MNETIFARHTPKDLPFMYPIILRLQNLRIVDKFNKQTNNHIGTFMTRSLKQLTIDYSCIAFIPSIRLLFLRA